MLNFYDLIDIFDRHSNDIQKFIDKIFSKYIMNIDMPCQFPTIHDNIYTLYKNLRIDEDSIKHIINEEKLKTKYKTTKLKNAINTDSQFLLMLYTYYIIINNQKYALRCILICVFRHYCLLMRGYFRSSCESANFYKALELLSKRHLFNKYGTILKGLIYLGQILHKKYKIKDFDFEKLITLNIEMIHRINQSCKSFKNAYTKTFKEFKTTSTDDKTMGITSNTNQDLINKYIDIALKNMFVYKVKYDKIIPYIQGIIGLKKSISQRLIDNIYNLPEDNIREAYIHFINELNDIKILQDKYTLVKFALSRLSVKITNKEKYFKQQMKDILINLLYFDPELKQIYDTSSKTTKIKYLQTITVYLVLYLSLSNNLI